MLELKLQQDVIGMVSWQRQIILRLAVGQGVGGRV